MDFKVVVARNTALQLLRVLLSNQRLKSISERIGKACLFRACGLRYTIQGVDGPTITSCTFLTRFYCILIREASFSILFHGTK